MNQRIRSNTRISHSAVLLCLYLAFPTLAGAADLIVRITGFINPFGQVGCALFSDPSGFPMDNSAARMIWQAADADGANCRFEDVPAGTYAVSIAHDVNGNQRIDTNFLGLPTEQWGVSNNVRPSLRAPRFEESSFRLAEDAGNRIIEIEVAK
jgi:uncharacterized protein (DUF2141 family)